MTARENHTPTPWKVAASIENDFIGVFPDTGESEFAVCKMPDFIKRGVNQANVEFIVTAVNSYDSSQAEIERLRTALEYATKGLDMILNGLMDPTRPRQSVGEVCAHFLDAANKATALGTKP